MRVLGAMVAALVALGSGPAMADSGIVLTPASQTANVIEGATDATIMFDATTPAYAKPYLPDVLFDPAKLTLAGPISMTAPNTYHVTLKAPTTLPGGVTTGTITFHMCRDSPCAHPIPGTEQVFAYTINVALKDWVTYQRDAGHSGYVHASYSGIVKKRWMWQPAGIYSISPVATKGSSIFVVQQDHTGTSVVSLSMLGASQWASPIGGPSYVGAPAVAGDKVYVPSITSSSTDNPITALDVNTGALATPTITFDSQWSPLSAPTPFSDSLYYTAGYYGNEVISYDLAAHGRRWSSTGQGPWIYGGETPAVNDGYVYYYSGTYLDIFDRATGQRTVSIADPYFNFSSYYYFGAPMLGTSGNVILLSGTGGQRPLVKFTLAGTATQLGSGGYQAPPAFANAVIYAAGTASNGVAHLDAVNEADGAILWTWSPPADDLTPLINNVIATDTLIFASTQLKLYAISATDPTRPVVWSAATPGNIAISGDGLLLVSTSVRGGPALVAYSLK